MRHFSTRRLSGVFLFFVTAIFLFFTSIVSASELDIQLNQENNRLYAFLNTAEISIGKTAVTPVILAGDSAGFKIVVTNSGTINLFDVKVTDELVPSCDSTISQLVPQQTVVIDCLTGPLTDNMTNTVEVFGKYGSTATFTVEDSAQAMVEVQQPVPSVAIDLMADETTIYTNDTAVFTVSVTNDGEVDLTNVVIDSPIVPDCDKTFNSLQIGETEDYECELPAATQDFTNTVNVNANAGTSGNPSDSDSVAMTVNDLSISITKTALTPEVVTGGIAEFQIRVQNTGDVRLFNIIIEDPLTPDCDNQFNNLFANSTQTYTCFTNALTTGFTNEATARGRDAGGTFVTDTDTATVSVSGTPNISLTKTANPSTISSGQSANFDFVITNNGTIPLVDVVLDDEDAPSCSENNLGDLDPGETIEISCQITGLVTHFTNTATVKAETAQGIEVSDSSTDTVTVNAPAVSISVSPPSQEIDAGNNASFMVTVENVGNRQLKNVSVSSSSVADCNENLPNIPQNNSSTFTCVATNVQTDFVNELTVNATGTGIDVSDSTSAIVQVNDPTGGILVAISPGVQTIQENEDAEFTVIVVNSSDENLNDVSITSDLVPDCDLDISILPPDAVIPYDCAAQNVTSSFINTLNVTGKVGNTTTTVEKTALAIVNVTAVDISVTAETTQLTSPGGIVQFNATITNNGGTNITLENLTSTILGSQTDPSNAPLVNSTCQENHLILSSQTYNCSFEIDVSGATGNYEIEVQANVSSSNIEYSETAVETVTINAPPETKIYIPIIIRDRPEEPNDVCTEAFPLEVNTQYSFLPDDQNDLFTFELTQTSDLVINLTNFTPKNGQIVLYRGDCSSPQVIANNGNSSVTKTLTVQNQPADTYIILIVTDGTFSTTPYNLIVNSQ